ncbi:tRNA lysidine(34) synthetase TilS [Candidatus Saccharibacteria bacterium]|nr:tRNA lysidine(34) synthetase TilS [Candidatus Saccharibacteria bacterium]
MKYILAISGGVDSVVLLDMIARGKLLLQGRSLQGGDLVVAHFDHGVRDNSASDAKLVQNLAAKYQIECVIGRGQLEKNTSEELLRAKRYEFLRSLCKDGVCKIVTAHHQNDLLETIVMNLIRGTSWRGLAPFWSDDIIRPLLGLTKAEIVTYAINHDLVWTEDETNYLAKYFRNRTRDFITHLPVEKQRQLLELNQKQIRLRTEIENILTIIPTRDSYSIENIIKLPDNLRIEILRKIIDRKLTTPQLKRLSKNLKTAKSGDIFQPGGKIQIGVYQGYLAISRL